MNKLFSGAKQIFQKFKRKFLLWLDPTHKITFLSETAPSYVGRGFVHKGKTFINHSGLKHHETAHLTVYPKQKLLIAGLALLLAAALFLNWHATIVVFLAGLTSLYFLDVLFNLFLVWRSFAKSPEIKISREQTEQAANGDWPMYTIFCPLYKEWQVVPQFVEAINHLDYPKDRLQVMLLLEEDDTQTIEKIQQENLPSYFEVCIVPHSNPKTKPKAMNYGLSMAKGKYLVIYDAEDVPEPLQLKKAVLAFEEVDPATVCIQAKLNFYNPRQNTLTKLFTAEYSLWFDLVLTGLQSIKGPIPLGGTSNHFKTEILRELDGWDAFNVTEDCDLGLRLFKRGYQTAMMDSTTYEEANSGLINWYRQRSRWIKGYIQTYLVHTRDPKAFVRSSWDLHALTFQLVVGGKILFMFVNPLLWIVTGIYFVFREQAAPIIESFFPAWVLYLGVFCFVFGNFLYMYYYMLGLAKRGLYDLIKYTAFVPLYWLGISIAGWKAVYEIIYKPHYWQKTVHGLHLKPEQEIKEAVPVMTGRFAALRNKVNAWQNHQSAGATIFVFASLVANFTNFLFSAFLGRELSLENFGTLTLFNTLFAIAAIIFSALGSSVNFQTAFLSGRNKLNLIGKFTQKTIKLWLLIAGASVVVWLVAVPWLSSFFSVDNWVVLALFAPVLVAGTLSAIYAGQLRGEFMFGLLGRAIIVESVSKLIAAVALVYLGAEEWVVLSLPISITVSLLMTWSYARRKTHELSTDVAVTSADNLLFPQKFFGAAVLSGLAIAAFLNVDVLLAKHYLSSEEAGSYALLSLSGKMVFFFGSLLVSFITSIVSRHLGADTDSRRDFHKLFNGSLALTFIAFLGVGVFGKFTVPILFGDKALVIVPHLLTYAAAMSLFTIAGIIISYHLAKREYSFAWIGLISAAVLSTAIVWRHNSIHDFTTAVFAVSILNFAAIFIAHAVVKNARFVIRNITDMLDVFLPTPQALPIGPDKKRILIFNWRDTKHEYAGGAEVYIHELAKRWVGSGNQVTLFCGNDGQSKRNDNVDGVKIVRRGGFYFVYVWAMLYYLVQFRGKFDVIIDCQNGIPFFTPLYAKEPVYCLMHHVHQEVFRKYLIKPLAMTASFLERTVMPWAYAQTQFITVSDSSQQEMVDMGLGLAGLHVVHPGVDLENLVPGAKDPHPLVLYLGRLKSYKSVDVLIESFRLVKAKIPTARLVIAGSGEEHISLKKLTAKVGFNDREVMFTGKLTEAEKVSWLQRAWVFVNPSMMEGWGITSIEANACGVPVVASNVPGLRDSVHNPHTGYLVAHGDVEIFAARIVRILENKGIRDFMAKEGIQWASNFSWDKSASRSLEIIYGE